MSEDMPLAELKKEQGFGGYGVEVERDIPQIDMSDFSRRKPEITEALWQAATDIGFFPTDEPRHPASADRRGVRRLRGFLCPALRNERAVPAETRHQCRLGIQGADPSLHRHGGPEGKLSDHTAAHGRPLAVRRTSSSGFKAVMLAFERQNWALAMKVLSCFADRLGFAADAFTEGHDPLSPEYQSTLRLIHYLGMEDAKPEDFSFWRAGAHTDFDCLTLLHQKAGQGGLQLCPGKDAGSDELAWTDVPPIGGVVTCNIGDMLMRWSDDRLLSNLHRVRMPKPDEDLGPRYSIAFFAQANKDVVLQGPEGKYEPITAHDYIQMRLGANFKKTS